MKITALKTFSTVLASLCYLCSYGQVTFQETVGAGGIDKINSITAVADEGFIVAGESSNKVEGKSNAFIAKLNKTGQIVWVKTYGTAADKESLNDICPATDKSFVAVGERYLSNPVGRGEVGILLKTDASGTLIWWKEFDHNGNEAEGFSLQETADKGWVTAGMMKDLQEISDPFFTLKKEDQHLYVLKTDIQGMSQWAGYFSGAYSSKGTCIRQTKDKGFIITGYVYQSSHGDNTNICLVKLDEKGNLQWVKVYDNEGKKKEAGEAVILTDDNGFMISGMTFDAGAGESDIFLLKTNSNGEIAWKKTYGGSKTEMAKSIQHLAEGGYIVSGTTNSFGDHSNDIFLLKVNETGVVEWFKTYGTDFYEMATGMAVVSDGYALGGFNINSGVVDGVFIRTDKKGNNTCNNNYSLKSGDFPLSIIKHENLKWEISRNVTMVKQANANGSSAELPEFSSKPFCEPENGIK